MIYNLRHMLYINAILMFLILFLVQLFTDVPIKSLLITRIGTILIVQSVHALYQYLFQDYIVHYGFLEHDDYQVYFQTFNITPGYLIMLPLLSYTATVIFSLTFTVIFKYVVSGGWIIFSVFTSLPKSLNHCRRYISASLGLLFMALFGVGFFMNLYYLFVCASLVLFWSTLMSFSKV